MEELLEVQGGWEQRNLKEIGVKDGNVMKAIIMIIIIYM